MRCQFSPSACRHTTQSIQRSRGARWVVGGEYESRHIPNFNWSFLLNYAVNLRFDWNIVFVRINVTKWGPICYLYFLILVFQHLNIIVQHFQYTTPTYILCDFNICLKNVELVFQSVELVFFSVLNEFGKNVESSTAGLQTAATEVGKHMEIW